MIPETPINAGHTYANAAEDFEDRGEWAKAAEAHQQAAEQFQRAIEFTRDGVASKTLRLLIADHARKSKELQRRAARAAKETMSPTVTSSQGEGSTKPAAAPLTDMDGLRNALPSELPRRLVSTQSHHGSASPAIGGSYAVLPTDGQEDEDDADPFNKFLNVVETLVDKLSNPVAFASAPLNENDNPTPAWTTTNTDNYQEDDTLRNDPSATMSESYFVVRQPKWYDRATDENEPDEGRQDLTLQAENEQLKKKIEQLTRRIQLLEKTAEESTMLKSSILQFRNDVHKQARRIMQTHDGSIMRASALGGSIRPTNNGNIDQLARIKELEEENRQLRSQNEKQKVLMDKYRERWQKLKESAKKRRADQAQGSGQESLGSSNSNAGYGLETSCSSEATGRQPTLLRSLAQQSTPAGSNANAPPVPPFIGIPRTSRNTQRKEQ